MCFILEWVYNIPTWNMFQLHVQWISLNQTPVNRTFRKWVGSVALRLMVDYDNCFGSYHNEPFTANPFPVSLTRV